MDVIIRHPKPKLASVQRPYIALTRTRIPSAIIPDGVVSSYGVRISCKKYSRSILPALPRRFEERREPNDRRGKGDRKFWSIRTVLSASYLVQGFVPFGRIGYSR